jgi:hypothetical protein
LIDLFHRKVDTPVTPTELRPRMLERAERHLTEVVDLTLGGAHHPA